MKFISKVALQGALFGFGLAQACANPVELKSCSPAQAEADCDIVLTPAAVFGLDGGAQGGAAGSFSLPTAGTGGNSGSSNGGSAGSQGTSGSGNTAGSSGAGGTAGSSGAGGTAGTAGTSGAGGTGGAAGSGGTAGTAGTAGTGGTSGGTFDPEACDFVDQTTGCANLACLTVCGTNDTNCRQRCPLIIDCLAADPSCITVQDPLCSARNGAAVSQCTTQVEQSGSLTQPGQPAFIANALVQCLCSDPRPN